ncbi:MAG TPA: M14 family zinc carboxypeptidase [Casimicrobiaceae bacterium]|nr:M14 family zinc carboxypeptidase [Casimicrobiaceae bacterium]
MSARRWLRTALVASVACAAGAPLAYYDHTAQYEETAAVAARFPDPPGPLATPGFKSNRVDFTSHPEILKFLDDLAKRAPDMRVLTAGRSIADRSIPLVVFAHPPAANGAALRANGKPTLLVIAGQHGDEPAGGEAALVLAQQLASPRGALLDRVNVLIVPRANPDGAFDWKRGLENGGDVDRDHLLQWSPEGRALGRAFADYEPAVVVDSREFGVKLPWLEKFGALQRYDVMLQCATVPNLAPGIATACETLFRAPLAQAYEAAGYAPSWHYDTSYDVGDLKVSMGSVLPDTGCNVAGLRGAISLRVASRGAGIGRAHFRRRVETHLLALNAALDATARHADEIKAAVQRARNDVVAAAGKGEFVVAGAATAGRQSLVMLDPVTGADKTVEVDWMSALEIRPLRSRARPYGYLLPASQLSAAMRLAHLGVAVRRVERDGAVELERYRIARATVAKKSGVRANDGESPIRAVNLEVAVERLAGSVKAGDFYVPLDQPLGNVVVAALEPDAESSYAANYVLAYPGPREPRLVPVYRLVAPFDLPSGPWSPP